MGVKLVLCIEKPLLEERIENDAVDAQPQEHGVDSQEPHHFDLLAEVTFGR